MTKSIWVFGDIHGHYDQMMRLIKKCQKSGMNLSHDTIIFLGDLVDGYPQVRQVIEQLIKWQKYNKNIIVLYGNHEDLMLDALVYNGRIYNSYDLWFQQGGKQTYESYLPYGLTQYDKAISQVKDHILVEHLNWLRKLPVFYENDEYFFVHAGVLPNFSLQDHKDGLKGKGFKEDPYNNPDWWRQQMIWVRDLFIDSNFDWGKKIIYGHTATTMPNIDSNKIGIDGMFHNIGQLVALELPDERFYYEKSS